MQYTVLHIDAFQVDARTHAEKFSLVSLEDDNLAANGLVRAQILTGTSTLKTESSSLPTSTLPLDPHSTEPNMIQCSIMADSLSLNARE